MLKLPPSPRGAKTRVGTARHHVFSFGRLIASRAVPAPVLESAQCPTRFIHYCRVRDLDYPPERARPRAQQGANLKNAWFIRESPICGRCCGRGRPRSGSVVYGCLVRPHRDSTAFPRLPRHFVDPHGVLKALGFDGEQFHADGRQLRAVPEQVVVGGITDDDASAAGFALQAAG